MTLSEIITMRAVEADRQQALGLALIALIILALVILRRWWSGV
jgi:hypothetical protein